MTDKAFDNLVQVNALQPEQWADLVNVNAQSQNRTDDTKFFGIDFGM
jgi:hypothetical protein